MDAPSAEEQKKFDKLVVQEVKRADLMSQMQRDNSNSVLKNKLDGNLVAPKAFVQKTQEQLAYQKFNPRPPSAALNKATINAKKDDDDDDYENDGSDGFEKEDEDDDLKLEKIRKAMQRENAKAAKVAQNFGPVASKPVFVGVKQGPIAVQNRKDSSSVLSRLNKQQQDDDFIPDISNQKPSYLQRNQGAQQPSVVLPAQNITRFG